MNKAPSKGIAAVLAILFGTLGIHHFYLGKYNVAIAWFLLFLVFCWTFLVPVVLGIIGIIQGIRYLSYTEEDWEKSFGKN